MRAASFIGALGFMTPFPSFVQANLPVSGGCVTLEAGFDSFSSVPLFAAQRAAYPSGLAVRGESLTEAIVFNRQVIWSKFRETQQISRVGLGLMSWKPGRPPALVL
jgi:hypothetical protein